MLGHWVALVIPGIVGLTALAALRLSDAAWSGAVGLVGGVLAAPGLLVVGDREVDNGTVAVRSRAGEDLGSMPVEDFAKHLAEDVGRRGRTED